MISKKIILGFGILFIAQCAYALNVVYPKQKAVTINSPSTFFIGSSAQDKPLTVNGEKADVHPSGGFAKVVPLKFGENFFTIKSGSEVLNYKITRTQPKTASTGSPIFKPYNEVKYIKVAYDNMPLRSTPVDAGINRLAHLQTDIPLVADGEKSGFYRVKLGDNKYGWISKNYVTANNSPNKDVLLTEGTVDADDEFFIYKFKLTSRVPWSIEESEKTLDVSLYNIVNAPNNNSYTIKIPYESLMEGKNLIGYTAYFSDTDFIVKIRKPLTINQEKPLKDIKIAIDAGHGGSEIGAIGCLGDYEKDINLKYAKDLAEILKSKGAEVYMTRNGDEYIGLRERVDKANKEDSVIFISLHGNALSDHLDPIKASGSEIYYYYPQSKPLADTIMKSMVDNAGVKNHGIIQQSFAVVRNTNALSILIEVGYLINPSDNAQIIKPEFRKKIVEAITSGLENYILTK